MNPRRMEAEAVRDNLLRVSGNLDPTLGGPDLDPETGLTSRRRSLYFRHAKEKRVTFLKLFDSSNVQSCYRRSESVVPQQALALANSPLSFAQARRLAGTISSRARGSTPSLRRRRVRAASWAGSRRPRNGPSASRSWSSRPGNWPSERSSRPSPRAPPPRSRRRTTRPSVPARAWSMCC